MTVTDQTVFTFVVDYDRSIKDGVKAVKCTWVNPDITDENFPASEGESGKRECQFFLYKFNNNTKSGQVIAILARDGKHSATIREVLAFGEANSQLQRPSPVIGLGSVLVDSGDNWFVVYLDKDRLGLEPYSGGWGGEYDILAVK